MTNLEKRDCTIMHYMYFVLYVHLEKQHIILFHLPDFFVYLKICSQAQSAFWAGWNDKSDKSLTWKMSG